VGAAPDGCIGAGATLLFSTRSAAAAAPDDQGDHVTDPAFAYRLGKQDPKHDPRTFQLATYLTDELPPAPSHRSWTAKVQDWGMLGNDQYGDCVFAGALHMVQDWTAYESTEFVPTDQQALDAYSAVTGFDPNDPSTDNGANMLDSLNYWRKTGIGEHQIMAFAACEPGNGEHVRDAINLFQAAYVGIGLPITAQRQKVWSVPPQGPVGDGAKYSWGGHCVPIIGYSRRRLVCVTWGGLKYMTWRFFQTYCDEAYAVLSQDWAADGTAPNGFDLAELQKDLASLGG
jgi:hypothetical protein